MNRFSSFVDVAGRVSRSTETFHRVTAAAVTLPTADVALVRSSLPGTVKWSGSDLALASRMIDVMIKHAVAVAVLTVNKRTPAWEEFWVDSLAIEQAIKRQDGKPAGFVRASNVLRFHLMGSAASMAFGRAHFLTRAKSRIVDYLGSSIIAHDITFDSDIQGAENVAVFRNMMAMPSLRSEQAFNFRLDRRVSLKTEQDEPLLLLADFAAGIAHAAHLPEAGDHLPISQEEAKGLMRRLNRTGLLVVQVTDFNWSAREVFEGLLERINAASHSNSPDMVPNGRS